MSATLLELGPRSRRPFDPESGTFTQLPVLIQVPALEAVRPRYRQVQPASRPAVRRRLRREVRWAGFAAVVVCAGWVGSSWRDIWPMVRVEIVSRLDGMSGRSGPNAPAHEVPSLALQFEPLPAATLREQDAPVVLPGYLLPADGTEDPSHAGH